MSKVLVVSLVIQLAHSNAFRIEPKVIAGTLSNSSDVPYFVAIADNEGIICSGSLLSDRYDDRFTLRNFIRI